MVGNKRIKYETKEQIAYVGFGHNNEKAQTVLDEETLRELGDIMLDVKAQEKALKGVIFHSVKVGCFLAGADIKLIETMQTESDAASGAEKGQMLYNGIEDLKIPTVAAIDGPCLGGGLELVLSCKSILCSDSSKTVLGLPEVKLGILPGFGGTYRLPRRIGLPKALDIILTGKMVKPKSAYKLHLVDGVFPKERLLAQAINALKRIPKGKSFKDTLESFATDNFVTRKIIFQKARESVLKKTKGFYPSPLKILDVMESGAGKGRSSYLAHEAQAFGELCVSDTSRNLRHLFFLMEGAKKYNGPKSTRPIPELKRGAALGAGTMGGGIAWLMADNGMAPLMKDLNKDALELGMKQAARNFSGALKRRKMTPDEFERKQRSIVPVTDFTGFKNVDLVIEAIVENLEIKQKVFKELEQYIRPDCVVASNTSSLRVTQMAQALEHPERFAGLHFFNPVHLMPLVEIVTHDKADPSTIEALYNWVIKVKKTPVIVKDGPGFLVNRILMPYLNEAGFLLEEGVSIKDLDDACLNFGMPMGPCRLLDEIGIDVAVKVAKIMHHELGERAKSSTSSQQLVDNKFFGKKSKKGFYLYDENEKEIGLNEAVVNALPKSKKMDEIDIQMRVFLPMLNEAAYILSEGLVLRPSDVDLALIFGIGFPPFRGGLLRYADSEGVDRIYRAIENFSKSVDADRYCPSPFLKKMVDDKKKFYDL
ncbi:MAG: hypothetical protein A2X86_21030 [Bdellovibrionales bacterium GWA2_49_15]|nr:MAG: hypothetical protein A2X86_21030 [Bdellovibrionales bacterium GWA2_49_15]HAZ14863.1 fatty oxidation complex subunit alpha [Bdellovibrionales bacterium]